VNKALLDLLKADQEKFGTFPEDFGNKGTGDEREEDQGGTNDHRVPWDGDLEIPNVDPFAFYSGLDLADPSSYFDAYNGMVSGDGLL
jgi:hypothetical protein